jgi:hypothetical protein
MFALYKISTNTVLQQWASMPTDFFIPEEKISVLAPDKDWCHEDYKIIPVKHKRRSAPHRFAKFSGSAEKVAFANNEPYLEVGVTFSEPSLDEIKGGLFQEIDTIAKQSQTIDTLDLLSYLEALEVIEDHTPTIDEYPLVALWVDATNPAINNILEAALFVVDRFKKRVREIAHMEKVKAKLKIDVSAANSAVDADRLFKNVTWVEKE